MKADPVGFWTMEHELVFDQNSDLANTVGTPCEAEPEGHADTPKYQATRVPKAEYLGLGRACNGNVHFGDPCHIDAMMCSTEKNWASNLVVGLTGEQDAKATAFNGEEYVRIPDHPLINTNASGYDVRTVEL